jgi:hypothetical protein
MFLEPISIQKLRSNFLNVTEYTDVDRQTDINNFKNLYLGKTSSSL